MMTSTGPATCRSFFTTSCLSDLIAGSPSLLHVNLAKPACVASSTVAFTACVSGTLRGTWDHARRYPAIAVELVDKDWQALVGCLVALDGVTHEAVVASHSDVFR
eukprot:8378139-Pyramimonas_sp.AAC.1